MDPINEAVTDVGGVISAWSFGGAQFVLVTFMAAVYLTGMLRIQLRSRWEAISIARMLYGIGGFSILIFALSGPPDAFSDEMFLAHMLQHILIAMVASVLLLAAKPMACFLWAMPETVRIGLAPSLGDKGWIRKLNALATNPRLALPAFILTLWGWHIPQAYELAIRNEAVHIAMHLSMFSTAILFWWPIIGPPPVRSQLTDPQRIIYLILVVTPTAVLAAIITLSNSIIYTSYVDTPHHFTLNPWEDQRVGGLLMWIPGNIVYLATLTTLFFRWFGREEKSERRTFRPSRRHASATLKRLQELEKRESSRRER